MNLDKTPARQAAFARRKVAHGQGLDGAARARLKDWLAPHQGKVIAGYMPIRTEIDPRPIMAEMSLFGAVGVPVIKAPERPLIFARWTPVAAMRPGDFGALVPEAIHPVTPDIIIVPLVAFDDDGNRLGYGGGFYDRTLEALRGRRPTLAVGFAYEAQRADRLPLEPTDQPLDAIVTEARLRTF